ncbi:MAG: GGDEF domain-containing protein [Myxococcota bacterium]
MSRPGGPADRDQDDTTGGGAEPTQILRRRDVAAPVTVVRVPFGPGPLQLWTARPGTSGVIGRSPDADLVLYDPSVSRFHARIDVAQDGALTLVDLNSTNGTMINHEALTGSAPIRAGDRVTVGAVAVSIDVMLPAELDQLRKAASRLDAAARDPLTGLVTRRWIDDDLPSFLERHVRHGDPLTCVFLDVDGFKQVNDRLGHQHGDEVLRRISELVLRAVRADDVAVRYGGDEIVLFLAKCAEPEALQVTDRLRLAVAELGTVTLSAGIAQHRGEAAEAWLARADRALYQAKRTGRNRAEPAD